MGKRTGLLTRLASEDPDEEKAPTQRHPRAGGEERSRPHCRISRNRSRHHLFQLGQTPDSSLATFTISERSSPGAGLEWQTFDRLAHGGVQDISTLGAVDAEPKRICGDDTVHALESPLLVDLELVRLGVQNQSVSLDGPK